MNVMVLLEEKPVVQNGSENINIVDKKEEQTMPLQNVSQVTLTVTTNIDHIVSIPHKNLFILVENIGPSAK